MELDFRIYFRQERFTRPLKKPTRDLNEKQRVGLCRRLSENNRHLPRPLRLTLPDAPVEPSSKKTTQLNHPTSSDWPRMAWLSPDLEDSLTVHHILCHLGKTKDGRSDHM
jgi:hypothetical protein